MSRILCLDPAGGSFGVAVLEVIDGKIYIPMNFLLTAPESWDISKKNSYMAHSVATIIGLEKPDFVVSERPWGAGFSRSSISELIGAIKAESWTKIEWQTVSEARRGVIGDGYGGADKFASADWLSNYPFSISAKNIIKSQLDTVDKNGKIGFDILDAILHGLYFLIDRGEVVPVHKEPKKKRIKKVSIIHE